MMIIKISKLLMKLTENSLLELPNSITQNMNYYLENLLILREPSEAFLIRMILGKSNKIAKMIINFEIIQKTIYRFIKDKIFNSL